MALATVASRALVGVAAPEVAVEVHLGPGLPAFGIVGLPDTEVREAKDRVRAALSHAHFDFPARRITVTLAPADLPKDSSRFDLPIALGILAASGQVRAPALAGHEFVGELSLTGELRPVRGALPMALGAAQAGRAFVLPMASAAPAALAAQARVLGARSLLEVCAHLAGDSPLAAVARGEARGMPDYPDLVDVRGQTQAKRALEIAAAGAHALLMLGPPGTGKSLLAARLPGLLPPMSEQEALEAATVQSASRAGFDVARWGIRPFRAPHHSASSRALVGGGNPPQPGEITLAHQGVLFLDELTEFPRDALEALREPLEAGHIAIARAACHVQYPARFQLVAAMNPCACGYLGDASGRCRCTPDQVARYRGRVSGPLADRIDLKIEVPRPSESELLSAGDAERSSIVCERVRVARSRQQRRQEVPNAWLGAKETLRHCRLEAAAEMLLKTAIARLSLSARAVHRVLRVARTIADLGETAVIDAAQVAEAIQYRRMDAAL